MSPLPRVVCFLPFILTVFSLTAAHAPVRRATRYADISPEFRRLLNRQGINENNFAGYVKSLDERTRERESEGESEHLIYFALQSGRFTRLPRIEPALGARDFVESLRPEERSRYLGDRSFLPPFERLSSAAASRLRDFAKALEKATSDERLAYFRVFLQRSRKPGESSLQYLYARYARAMWFLYQKEFAAQKSPAPLYEERGHSTDTQIEANYAVYTALAVLKAQREKIAHILIVGPGLDFAPRTDLIDLFEPQSYQPFAIADALLGLQLSERERLSIHCVDINERVVTYLKDFPQRRVKKLSILSGVADSDRRPFTDEYKSYFEGLGKEIGSASSLNDLPRRYDRHLKKSLTIDPQVASRISANLLNIITERYEPSPQYDLIVVTNVFPYFNSSELLLSLTNIAHMLRDGGYLVHNEPRPLLHTLAKAQHLPMIHSRSILIAQNQRAPLYDTVWIHRKITPVISFHPGGPIGQ